MAKLEIEVTEIITILEDVLKGELSREEASDWALKMILADDNGNLAYLPEESEDLIFEGILYILGIDLPSAPGVYLHCPEDFMRFLDEFKEKMNK